MCWMKLEVTSSLTTWMNSSTSKMTTSRMVFLVLERLTWTLFPLFGLMSLLSYLQLVVARAYLMYLLQTVLPGCSFAVLWNFEALCFMTVHPYFLQYDIVRLEWLSNFVQDSLSKVKALPLCHAKRARSKRPRPATFYPPPSYFLCPKKKQKKKLPTICGSNGQSDNKEEDPLEDPPRKCTHCEITKTPLWRTGPNGPKTLCNACGVRYKKGLLFPEYRPAASPTFVPLLHSNSYKKVFEMRKSKNLGETVQPEHCLNSNQTDKGHEITNSTLCGEALEARKGTFTTLEDPVTTSDLGETVQPEHCLNSNKTDKGLEITNSALCGETFEAGKVRSTTLEDSVTTSDLVSLQV